MSTGKAGGLVEKSNRLCILFALKLRLWVIKKYKFSMSFKALITLKVRQKAQVSYFLIMKLLASKSGNQISFVGHMAQVISM